MLSFKTITPAENKEMIQLCLLAQHCSGHFFKNKKKLQHHGRGGLQWLVKLDFWLVLRFALVAC